uniref:Uncharacterized protein n=1 Tax=Globisporangium ultimum (strain ATCC 200006 / CBS 805.95 / DAOM BR144) TaxID=431595 RepID=K3WVF1_GLOUD
WCGRIYIFIFAYARGRRAELNPLCGCTDIDSINCKSFCSIFAEKKLSIDAFWTQGAAL